MLQILCLLSLFSFPVSIVRTWEIIVKEDDVEVYRNDTVDVGDLQSRLHGNGDEGKTQCRKKRSTSKRRDHRSCLLHYERIKDQSMRLAMMKNVADRLVMSCYYCGDSKTKSMHGVVWYRIHRDIDLSKGYQVSEVKVDMHDKEVKNRVVVTPDHSLVIKKTRIDDSGGYFCKDSNEGKGLKYIHGVNLQTIMSSSNSFKVLYHVDVIPEKDEKFKKVSRTGILSPKPTETLYLTNENLIAFTKWDPWSVCSVCGKVGERKRKGYCFVKKSVKKLPSKPWHINDILKFYPRGIPCRSSLFSGSVNIKTRPNELMVDSCEVKCQRGKAMKGGQELSQLSMKFTTKKKTKGKYPVKRKFKFKERKTVRLFCPGSRLSSLVSWVNGTNYITPETVTEDTDGRVDIDDVNSLIINGVRFTDSAVYSCWYDGKMMAKIYITVQQDSTIDGNEVYKNFEYLLLSYVLDFVVVLFCIILKHKHRKTQAYFRSPGQKRKDNKYGQKMSDLSDETSSCTSFNSHESKFCIENENNDGNLDESEIVDEDDSSVDVENIRLQDQAMENFDFENNFSIENENDEESPRLRKQAAENFGFENSFSVETENGDENVDGRRNIVGNESSDDAENPRLRKQATENFRSENRSVNEFSVENLSLNCLNNEFEGNNHENVSTSFNGSDDVKQK